jgi:hypothetical protein
MSCERAFMRDRAIARGPSPDGIPLPREPWEHREFRTAKLTGGAHKPGKVWVGLDGIPKLRDPNRIPLFNGELEVLKSYADNWDI